MDDDLNTADGISAIFELVTAINTEMRNKVTKAFAKEAIKVLMEFCDIIGILRKEEEEALGDDIMALVEERQERKNKDFARADAIRDELKAKGITLKDTPQGVQIIKE